MNYLGFARKYRPQGFAEVVGQEHIATTLKNAIQINRIHHAYLFCGSRGVGKTSMARIFSKALNCTKGLTTTPCNECGSCQRISTGEDIDVLEIDGASNRGIEEIRNIKDDIKYLPTQSRFKIFIIDEVHMLTQAAFNALLKTLEEPPAHVKFIFATTEVSAIPDTILSRCQRFDFKRISLVDITKRLRQIADEESLEIADEVLEKMARNTGGALRDSLVLLDQLAAYAGKNIREEDLNQIIGSGRDVARGLVEALSKRDMAGILGILQDFFGDGGEPSALLEFIAQQFRDILICSLAPDSYKFVEGTEVYLSWLAKHKDSFSPEFVMRAVHYIVEARKYVQRDLLGRIVVEMVLLKICRMESLQPLDEMVKRLASIEGRIQQAPVMPAISPRTEVPPSVLVGMESKRSPQSERKERKQVPEVSVARQDTARKPVAEPPPVPVPGDPWQEFLGELAKHFPRAVELLRYEAKVEISADKVRISLKPEHQMTREMLSTSQNKGIVTQLAKKIFVGKTLHWEVPETDKNSANAIEMRNIAEKDPVVFRCLELFGGHIVGVSKVE